MIDLYTTRNIADKIIHDGKSHEERVIQDIQNIVSNTLNSHIGANLTQYTKEQLTCLLNVALKDYEHNIFETNNVFTIQIKPTPISLNIYQLDVKLV